VHRTWRPSLSSCQHKARPHAWSLLHALPTV
jgi:hypothetical protein